MRQEITERNRSAGVWGHSQAVRMDVRMWNGSYTTAGNQTPTYFICVCHSERTVASEVLHRSRMRAADFLAGPIEEMTDVGPLSLARHGGISTDVFEGVIDLPTAKKRGQWLSDNSVRRYEKHARLIAVLDKLSPDQQGRATKSAKGIGKRILAHRLL